MNLKAAEQLSGLTQISFAAHHGCMGLPQELIDYIMDILHDDLQTLKASSLTCKAMFASSRHLIHQTLHLTRRNNEKILTQGDLCQSLSYCELRLVSYMGECGFLQYTRQVHVRDPGIFIPNTLLPHIQHFQSLDRVHTLIIEHYDAVLWAKHYKSCFVHFYPTLTSLTLRRPFGRCRTLLRFALQFPNLEHLCFEWLRGEEGSQPVPATADRFPPARGHLRLTFGALIRPPEDFVHVHELRNRISFRSAQFESDFYDIHAQHMLNMCAHTLENLTIESPGTSTRRVSFLALCIKEYLANFFLTGYSQLYYLQLAQTTVLHRLTCRLPFHLATLIKPDVFVGMFSTITSPFFCEFVLELSALPFQFDARSPDDWGRWREIDKFLEDKFSKRGDFKVIIRAAKPHGQAIFQRCVKGGFPLLARRGCVHFEASHDS